MRSNPKAPIKSELLARYFNASASARSVDTVFESESAEFEIDKADDDDDTFPAASVAVAVKE